MYKRGFYSNQDIILSYTTPSNLKMEILGITQKFLDFKKIYMKTHSHSDLLISKFSLGTLSKYLIDFGGVTR